MNIFHSATVFLLYCPISNFYDTMKNLPHSAAVDATAPTPAMRDLWVLQALQASRSAWCAQADFAETPAASSAIQALAPNQKLALLMRLGQRQPITSALRQDALA